MTLQVTTFKKTLTLIHLSQQYVSNAYTYKIISRPKFESENTGLKYTTRDTSKDEESKFNGRHILVKADDVHLLCKHIYTVKRNREDLFSLVGKLL